MDIMHFEGELVKWAIKKFLVRYARKKFDVNVKVDVKEACVEYRDGKLNLKLDATGDIDGETARKILKDLLFKEGS